MRRIILTALVLFFIGFVSAQTQQGYVKTKGRLSSKGSVIPGTHLSGATIIVKGVNAVVSGNNGQFSVSIPSSNYYLQSVQKQGYVLTDPDILSKPYVQSKNPLVIVLEDKEQQAAERRAIERKISSNLYAQLQKRNDELEALREEQKITEEKYRELLQKLNSDQDNNETIIQDMAERYARIDFDQTNEFNRRISDCIINGRLTEADSLLKTKGDINERIERLNKHHDANVQTRSELELSESMEQKTRDDLAQDCYSKFEICKIQHLNDSAAYYLEQRVRLDTTNVDWLSDVGDFIVKYKANYSLGLLYYQKALKCAQKTGKSNKELLYCYNNLGIVNNHLGNNTTAMECYNKCLEICKEDSIAMCTILRHIGNVYYDKSDYDEALSYYKKALDIREHQHNDDDKEDIAQLYENIGTVYSDVGNFNLAKDYFDKSYEMIKQDKGDKSSEFAGCLLNMGFNYIELKDFDNAMECFQRSVKIFIEIYGEIHPHVAVAYGGLGSAYGGKKDYANELKFKSLGLSIKKKIYGDKHQSVAIGLNNIGMAYMNQKEYDKAIESFLQSLDICRIHYGEKHAGVAVIYRNLGFLYKEIGQYDNALDYYLKSLKVAQLLYGEDNQVVQVSVNNLGRLYYVMENYPLAIHYLKQSLIITEKVYVGNESKLRDAVQIMNKAYQAALEENNLKKELCNEFDAFKKKYSQYIEK
jgi:tetratricopeptide (TPR) repeat protein